MPDWHGEKLSVLYVGRLSEVDRILERDIPPLDTQF